MGDIISLEEPAGPKISRPSKLLAEHDTSKFFSKHECLNDWLKYTALKSEGRTARTYVVCSGSTVVGYYCLATGSVARLEAPKRLRRNAPNELPAMIVGRLAVDTHFEGQGIGSGMLKDAFQRIVQASEHVGCRTVIVHAIDADAVSFYAQYGFIEFPNGTRTMFLLIETVRAAVAAA